MNNKELKIQVPEGYEIDQENSTFELIKFKPLTKKLTYADVAKALFYKKEYCSIKTNGEVLVNCSSNENICDANNAVSKRQLHKLLAINKLMNVAKYLNEDWRPDWTANNSKYALYLDNGNINVISDTFFQYSMVYFSRKELALQAVEILGEHTIRLALSTDW